MKTKKFTKEQIIDWKNFERVRSGGRFNMFDPRARVSTGLSPKEYSFVMDNYGELKNQSKETS